MAKKAAKRAATPATPQAESQVLQGKTGTVRVEAAEYHTAFGKEYQEGDSYDAPADLVDSLVAQGKAYPVEVMKGRKAAAKPLADPGAPVQKSRATQAKRSAGQRSKTAVAPIGLPAAAPLPAKVQRAAKKR